MTRAPPRVCFIGAELGGTPDARWASSCRAGGLKAGSTKSTNVSSSEPKRLLIASYGTASGVSLPEHVRGLITAVGTAIAELKSGTLVEYEELKRPTDRIYFLPDDTLTTGEALSLGIHTPADLYGGVVPFPFVRTKAITHPIIGSQAERPPGWSSRFSDQIGGVVLPGYTAFDPDDALNAAARLLRSGPIRIKAPRGASGQGQVVARTAADCQAVIDGYTRDELHAHGIVLEMNLQHVQTLNIGQVSVGELTTSYYGTQRVVTDAEGQVDYRGSDLICTRGDWDVLERMNTPWEIRVAITQARQYDRAAEEYPGFLASRRNYDVGQGIDAHMRWRSGVFEASWRVGAASTAEMAALSLFKREPELQVVHASAMKECGADVDPPRGAVVHFQGHDSNGGPLLRYTVVTRKVYAKSGQRQPLSS